jgi:hypothetical protein
MPGLGRKVFNAGEVLSAVNVQGYLQDQVVQVYSGTAARSSALGTAVSEGMASYLTDSNSLEVYTANGTAAAWSPVNLAQSPNVILNGGMEIWQRGISFSNPANSSFNADRFTIEYDGTGATRTISRQSFTPGTAPVAGYEAEAFLRVAQTVAGSGGTYQLIAQKIEDARTFAGQTATFSFWAKADTARTLSLQFHRNYGSGGSSTDFNILASAPSFSVTTSWARYSATVSIPSVSGETIGTSSFLWMILNLPFNTTQTVDIWGVQLEAGSVATPFRRNANSLQGELAACQRYYWRTTAGGTSDSLINSGLGFSGTIAMFIVNFPSSMRAAPSSIDVGNFGVYRANNSTSYSGGTWTINQGFDKTARILYTHGSSVFSAGDQIIASTTTSTGFFGLSAEL